MVSRLTPISGLTPVLPSKQASVQGVDSSMYSEDSGDLGRLRSTGGPLTGSRTYSIQSSNDKRVNSHRTIVFHRNVGSQING